MKLLSLLMVAIVLIGITTQAFAWATMRGCPRSPMNYALVKELPRQRKSSMSPRLTVAVCRCPMDNFAVVSWNNARQDLHVLQLWYGTD